MDTTIQPPATGPAGHLPGGRPDRSRMARRAGTAGAAVVALGLAFWGGAAAGAAGVDPTASEQYAQLAADHERLGEERDLLQEQYDGAVDDYNELVSGLEDREAELAEREAAAEKRAGELEEAEAAVAEREKAVGKAEKEKAANTVTNGVWTVGVDIAPGTYRADGPVDSDCYWAVLVTGSNGDIVDNDIPGGGRPQVTVSNGHDFETSRCGTWSKQ